MVELMEKRALLKFREFKRYWEEKGNTIFSDEEAMDYLLAECDCKVFLYNKGEKR